MNVTVWDTQTHIESRNYYRLAVITLKFLRQVAGAQCQFISCPTRNLFAQSSSKSWKNDFIFYFIISFFFSTKQHTVRFKKKVLTGYIPIVIVKAPRRSPRASKFVKGGGRWRGALDLLRCPEGCFFLSDFIVWRGTNTRQIYVSRIVISVKLCTLRSPK